MRIVQHKPDNEANDIDLMHILRIDYTVGWITRA